MALYSTLFTYTYIDIYIIYLYTYTIYCLYNHIYFPLGNQTCIHHYTILITYTPTFVYSTHISVPLLVSRLPIYTTPTYLHIPRYLHIHDINIFVPPLVSRLPIYTTPTYIHRIHYILQYIQASLLIPHFPTSPSLCMHTLHIHINTYICIHSTYSPPPALHTHVT